MMPVPLVALVAAIAAGALGVAIAIALMPPLVVVGFGIATWNWTIFSGVSDVSNCHIGSPSLFAHRSQSAFTTPPTAIR